MSAVTFFTALTIALTASALRNGRKGSASPIPAAVMPQPSHVQEVNPPAIDTDEPDAAPTPRVLVTPPPKQKTLSMKLPWKAKLSSGYGVRMDPFTGEEKFHGGVDFVEPKRSEVQAALGGKVTFVGDKEGYGRVIILEHTNGYQTLYAHLTKALVREGSRVKRGELIGLIGESGRATAPHLHFELRKDGKRVDPLRAKFMSKTS